MFAVLTEHPVAVDSLDHQHPYGTLNDNSGQPDFIRKLKDLGVESLLDLGCAGGLLVRQASDAGIRAVGLEGSDVNQKLGRAEWPYPGHLFTCDVTYPFSVRWDGTPWLFDCVTAWEFMEHIAVEDLPLLLANVLFHTKVGSVLFCSITSTPSPYEGVDLHRTQADSDWWDNLFYSFGWDRRPDLEQVIGDKWVRTGTFERAYVRVT